MSLPANHAPKEWVLNDREQIQYLMGNPPSWMMRYGIAMMGGFFMLLLCLSYFIRYPDVLESSITLTTANPPIRVMATTSARITELLIADHQSVEKGQVLALFENTADWHDVLRLENWLETLGKHPNEPLPPMQLGALQQEYSSFSQHWKDFRYFNTSPHTAERIAALEKQIAQLEQMNGIIARQNALLKAEFVISTQERDRQHQLHQEKVISDKEFEKSEAQWLQQKRQLETAEANLLQNQMQIQQSRNQVHELQYTQSDTQNEKELTLAEDIQRLRSAIAAWKQAYLVVAPIQGKVSLSKIWSPQQSVAAGDEVLAILPEGNATEQVIGKAALPGLSLGKLKPGNRAIVRLDAFPAQQYGAVEGLIANISALPQEETYQVDVSFPNALTTAYGNTIPFRQEMTGQVRIITEERRLMERVFERLNDLLKNQ